MCYAEDVERYDAIGTLVNRLKQVDKGSQPEEGERAQLEGEETRRAPGILHTASPAWLAL